MIWRSPPMLAAASLSSWRGGKPNCQLGKALVVAAAVGLKPFEVGSLQSSDEHFLLLRFSIIRKTTAVRELVVYYETRAVGVIEVHDEGPHFVYASGWLGTRGAFPISVTMPLSEQHVPPEVSPSLGSEPSAGRRTIAGCRTLRWEPLPRTSSVS